MKKIYAGVIIMLVAFFVGNVANAAEGDTWIMPVNSAVGTSANFDIKVYVDTGGKDLGAFNMYFDFDPAYIDIDLTQGNDGLGIDAGVDVSNIGGIQSADYVVDEDSESGEIPNGHYRFAGIPSGTNQSQGLYANGSNIHIVTIHAKTKADFTSGTTNLTLRVNELSEAPSGDPITIGTITGGVATYTSVYISEVTPIITPSNNTTPTYVFSATNLGGGNGTPTWGGSCNGHFNTTPNSVTNGNGNSFTATSAFVEGTYADCTLTVNDGTVDTNTLNIPSFTIDTTAPANPTVTIPVDNSITNDTTPTFTGTGTAGDDIAVNDGSGHTCAATIDGSGNWTCDISPALNDEDNPTFHVTETDPAGNTSGNTDRTITIDTTAPTLSETTPVTTPTADTTPDYIFTSNEAGAITYGGDCSSSDTSAVNGSNTITFNTLANGTHSNCTITVTDAAGNISSVLNVASFEVNASTCTSYTYSSWGSCQPSNTRTRTVLTSIPSGCVGGVSPVLSESCTYTAPAAGGVDVNNFTPKVKLKGVSKKIKLKKHKKVYIRKKKLSFKGDIDDLAGGRVEIYVDGDLKETATIGSNGKWKMKVKIKKSGKHKLRFKYFNATGDYIGESSRYYIKIDTRKPRFIHLPSFLTKYRGNVVHFEATDSKSKKVKTKKKNKIKYYKYYFLGKKVKTKKSSFVIPKNTLRGLHTLKVRAYDKAGNKTTKYVVIRVR